MTIERSQRKPPPEEENYFISMTDMMVGMVFLFIITLMFFALKFNDVSVQETEVINTLLDANSTRATLLQRLKVVMLEKGFVVELDQDNGILHLPENIMFDKGGYYLNNQGRRAVVILGKALSDILPCYAAHEAQPRPNVCPTSPHKVEAVFVEGHTDSDGEEEGMGNIGVCARARARVCMACVRVHGRAQQTMCTRPHDPAARTHARAHTPPQTLTPSPRLRSTDRRRRRGDD